MPVITGITKLTGVTRMQFSTGTPSYTYTTWNSADKSSTITLSNGDKTASGATLSFSSVRSILSVSGSNKVVAEFTIDTIGTPGDSLAIGIANSSYTLGTVGGSDADSWVLWDDGYKGNNNVFTNITSLSAGDIVSVLYDNGAKTINFYKNGSDLGTAFSGITGTIYFMYYGHVAANQITANFGQTTFTYSYPPGYTGLHF